MPTSPALSLRLYWHGSLQYNVIVGRVKLRNSMDNCRRREFITRNSARSQLLFSYFRLHGRDNRSTHISSSYIQRSIPLSFCFFPPQFRFRSLATPQYHVIL